MFDDETKDPTVKTAYICETDFDHHIEGDADGTVVFPTVRQARLAHACLADTCMDCRIYRVEIRVVEDVT